MSRGLWTSRWTSRAVDIVVDIQSGGGQVHVQTIQHHRSQQPLAVPRQVGQQQAHRGGRHFRVAGCQAIDPWPLHSFQVRQSLQTRHLDVGRGGSRHGRLVASTHFGEGASCSNSAAGRQHLVVTDKACSNQGLCCLVQFKRQCLVAFQQRQAPQTHEGAVVRTGVRH